MWSSPPSPRPRPKRRRRALGLIIIGVVVVIGLAATTAWWFLRPDGTADSPGMRQALFSGTSASLHAESEPAGTPAQLAAAYLAAQPTAEWLVPERDPIGAVGSRVGALASEAAAQDAISTIVVYGLPGRDCGNQSAGGLPENEYATWTAEIGDAVRASGVETIIVLEPDSIALGEECGNLDERARQLQGAVANLRAEKAKIYIDGGHSSWHTPALMAEYIRAVGVIDQVRGFATNVSNFNTDANEVAYAHALSALLGGTHAVIDSSRNGAGTTGEWCNPRDRRVGSAPGTLHDEVVDANLWIKVPGESDGVCNAGPAAGQWWPDIAIELTRDRDTDPSD